MGGERGSPLEEVTLKIKEKVIKKIAFQKHIFPKKQNIYLPIFKKTVRTPRCS